MNGITFDVGFERDLQNLQELSRKIIPICVAQSHGPHTMKYLKERCSLSKVLFKEGNTVI